MNYRCLIAASLVVFSIGIFGLKETAWADKSLAELRHVLLLNSYDQRMTWVQDVVAGVEDVLRPEDNNLSLHIENMDTKVFHSPEYFAMFKEYLQVKYRNTTFSLILSSDNNAYDFLRSYRDSLFPGVPVSFSGINDFAQTDLEGLTQFTGVAEIFSTRETIELALTLHPETKTIYVINDYLKTGRACARKIGKDLAGFSDRVQMRHSADLPIADLMQEIGVLGPNTLVLLGIYYSDRDGRYFTFEKIGEMLSKASNVPVYCLWEFNIGRGVVGGRVISGLYQGRTMAALGMKILQGKRADAIPVVMEGSNRLVFDYRQLERFGIDESNLPSQSHIINRPHSFYETYKLQVWIVTCFILVLLATTLALGVNVVRRTRAELALRASEERFRQLANASWEAILIHEKGILSHANDNFYDMFGYRPEEIDGKQVLPMILAKESIPEVQDRVALGMTAPYEVIGRHKSGVTFPIEVHVREVEIEGREMRMSAIRDLSERKRMEAQLAQSQKLEAIGTLAGGIAHDFNNILSAIIGYSELILTDLKEDSPIHHKIGEVLRAGNRARDLVQQILTFARKAKEEKHPVQVSLIVKEALKLLRASLPASIEIKSGITSSGMVMSDTTQVHQIMMNLCTNAAKAMVDGGVLSVTLDEIDLDEHVLTEQHLTLAPGKYLRLLVQDTGVGIPPEIQSRIFDPFFTTRNKGEGTGLGLSVVHGIVKDCQGAVTVKSKPGEGSIFTVYLPLTEGGQQLEISQVDELARGSERILFVDDEQVIVNLAESMLGGLGYKVTGCTRSPEALHVFRQQPGSFDLVITDMTMPKMNGDKLAKELLAIRSDVPIIICTGYSEHMSEEQALKVGIRRFIMKPVVMSTLAEEIRAVLDESTSAAPAGSGRGRGDGS